MCMRRYRTGWWSWSSSFFSLTCGWVHDGRDCDLWLRLQVRARHPRSGWWQWHHHLSGKLFPIVMMKKRSPLLLAFRGEPRNKTKLDAALTQDVDMLASFPGSFLLLAVWAGSYCKQWEAGWGPWNKAIDVQLPTLVLCSLWKHGIIFCVAVSSLHQCCCMLVVNYFRYTSGPVQSSPVRVLTRAGYQWVTRVFWTFYNLIGMFKSQISYLDMCNRKPVHATNCPIEFVLCSVQFQNDWNQKSPVLTK